MLQSMPETTSKRIDSLKGYMSNNVLDGRDFICKSHLSCAISCQPHLPLFYPGQLHHGKRCSDPTFPAAV
jgi:hypothetical protein